MAGHYEDYPNSETFSYNSGDLSKEYYVEGNQVFVSVNVTNMGDTYNGKEVIQIYVSLPQGKLPKKEKRLVAFAKTKLLVPRESQFLTLSFAISSCTSFEEERASYILEQGVYGIMVGNASDAVTEIVYLQTANSYDLLTNVLRREWEYQGMVMTDWNTTGEGGSGADLCIRFGGKDTMKLKFLIVTVFIIQIMMLCACGVQNEEKSEKTVD